MLSSAVKTRLNCQNISTLYKKVILNKKDAWLNYYLTNQHPIIGEFSDEI